MVFLLLALLFLWHLPLSPVCSVTPKPFSRLLVPFPSLSSTQSYLSLPLSLLPACLAWCTFYSLCLLPPFSLASFSFSFSISLIASIPALSLFLFPCSLFQLIYVSMLPFTPPLSCFFLSIFCVLLFLAFSFLFLFKCLLVQSPCLPFSLPLSLSKYSSPPLFPLSLLPYPFYRLPFCHLVLSLPSLPLRLPVSFTTAALSLCHPRSINVTPCSLTASQAASQPLSQPVSQSINHFFNRLARYLFTQSFCHSVSQSVNQSAVSQSPI